ncbi:HK97 family phage prohead protease [Comamonas testosteroni]|uniref:HK97 family phage prohead protease n=1 Tax=Comamonas testosteroni TaxID=285 RepID=UPI002E14E311|nr:HK97 family phage prohead protease [Comamonas testosteroni]WQD40833.1 HK97 family phage prohead protease [Comamonas testosteroni]
MEIRSIGGVQAQGRKVTGYAAVFNRETDLGEFREQIAPGAFRRSLESRRNIRALYDHQTGAVLGTTQASTLELREDAHGLHFTLELPDTTVGRDVAELVKRGDVAGCSFGFRIAPNGDKWAQRSGVAIRTLIDVDLAEITLTADPAYRDTEIALRSMGYCQRFQDARKLWLETCT